MFDFPLHTLDSAPADSRPLLAEAKEKYGFAPNLYRIFAEAPAALQAYDAVAAAFADSSLSDIEQQVVLLTASRFHACHYCMAAHSTLARMAGMGDDALERLREGRPLEDPRLEALRRLTLAAAERRGRLTEDDLAAFRKAGFETRQVLEVLTGIAQKTLSNYTNHLADTPVDEPFADLAWAPEEARAGA